MRPNLRAGNQRGVAGPTYIESTWIASPRRLDPTGTRPATRGWSWCSRPWCLAWSASRL